MRKIYGLELYGYEELKLKNLMQSALKIYEENNEDKLLIGKVLVSSKLKVHD